jgi:hypothetical protein
MLFKIAKPIGKPIMVMFKNQAMAIAIAPSHHPIKMNHRACIRQPGPESLWIVVDDRVGVSIDIMLRNLVLNFISSIVFFRFLFAVVGSNSVQQLTFQNIRATAFEQAIQSKDQGQEVYPSFLA